MRLALAIDGGNSKTDVALVREDGALLGVARGAGSSPHALGAAAALDLIGALIDEVAPPELPELTMLLLAGADFPDEEEELQRLAEPRGWSRSLTIRNDTFAVLRAGTDRGWGIAVVCGAGMNCVGVAPDGRHARFPALGAITGDWGGGYDLGEAALYSAVRSEDGRGPRTRLERSVAEHFALPSPSEVAHEIHRGRIAHRQLVELAPLVFAEAADDAVAAALVARQVAEVVAFVRVAAKRLGLEAAEPEVVLGGGLLQGADAALVAEIARGVHETVPGATVKPTSAPAILGSGLYALDELGAAPAAKERLRSELDGMPAPVTIGGGDG
ncbi:MAG TPA: BadF/BadG/BcrA/BcrD ATPase family protein [Gaiellaceae bacterium]|nr:BadF/BadG/BcrA/BcrD ATPase family protein [Gaiellaceae bacterium]